MVEVAIKSLQPASLSVEPGEGGGGKIPATEFSSLGPKSSGMASRACSKPFSGHLPQQQRQIGLSHLEIKFPGTNGFAVSYLKISQLVIGLEV
jgi:hypothetical protein